MTRRQWIAVATASPGARFISAAGPNAVETEIVRHRLRHTWTTVMSSSEHRDNLYVRFRSRGITGIGEAAPIARYKESAELAQRAVESVRDVLAGADPWKYAKLEREIFKRIEGQHAAKAAINIAVMDWVGQQLGAPLYRLFGLDRSDAPITTFSIGIDAAEATKEKVREAESFPVLKIKVGLDQDEQTMEAVRSVTNKPLRLDANEGFKNKEEAVRKINWLEGLGAELIEQPLPAHMIEESRWVRSKVHIPILADESCLHPEDIPKVADAFDGINVKLMKCGGLLEALRMIHTARAHGLKIMLGCMIESSVSITAAAHISPLVDWPDLDGNLLIANDPFVGVTVDQGKLILPERPGLGLQPRA